jgi:NDP-sugar pyrophosphorylase family protein
MVFTGTDLKSSLTSSCSVHEQVTASWRATGVILAGSHTSGRSSLDRLGYRALLPVGGRPLISHACAWLGDPAISDICVCANGISETLQRGLVGLDPAIKVRFRDDVPPRGPAGSAADVAAHCDTDCLVVIDCSTVPTVDLGALLAAHRATGAAATVVVQPHREHTLAERRAEVPAGIYVFDGRAFTNVPAHGFHDIKEGLLRQLVRAHQPIETYRAPEWCPRVVDTRSYLHVGLWAVARQCQQTPASTAEPSARVASGALLVGPVVLGARSVVMEGATVVGPALLQADTTVHAGAVVSRAVVGSGCVVGEKALVHRSVILDGVRVPDGARLIDVLQWPTSRSSHVIGRAGHGVGALIRKLVSGSEAHPAH